MDLPWWDLCGPCTEAEVHPPATEGFDPSAFTRHVSAAHGYLELGLPPEAWNELEAIEPPPRRAELPVLGMRVAIYHAPGKWEPMAEVCRHLATVEPAEVGWPMWLAFATHKTAGVAAARDILLAAMVRFPKEAMISYHLAGYALEVGDLEDARDCLRRAFELNPALRLKAIDDPDLAPLW